MSSLGNLPNQFTPEKSRKRKASDSFQSFADEPNQRAQESNSFPATNNPPATMTSNTKSSYWSPMKLDSPRPIPHRDLITEYKEKVIRILEDVDQREMSVANTSSSGLATQELHELSLVASASMDALPNSIEENQASLEFTWTAVDVDDLVRLCESLEQLVNDSVSINVLKDARAAFEEGDLQWADSSDLKDQVTSLEQGIQAATILLSIMVTKGIDRKVVSQDSVQNMIDLMRNHLGQNVMPALSSTGHLPTYATSNVSPASPVKKKQKVTKASKEEKATQQALKKFLKKVYKPITGTTGLLTNLMERLKALVETISIDDQPLLSISSACLSSLTIDPSSVAGMQSNITLTLALQKSCVLLVTAIFQHNPSHRTVMVEDLMPLFLQLPTSKKSMRTFTIRGNGVKFGNKVMNDVSTAPVAKGENQATIQVMTALILYMIQSCVVMPRSEQDEDGNIDKCTGLEICQKVCVTIVEKLVVRCAKKGDEGGASEFRPVLSNLVEDLLLVQLLPEFPAAEMLLGEICDNLAVKVYRNSALVKKEQSLSSETTFLTTAMDTIGTICSDIASKFSWAKDYSLSFPSAVDLQDLNPEADPNSEGETNACFCGRNVGDSFGLDCDRCHRWFHGSCVGISNDANVQNFICDECTDQAMVLDQIKYWSQSDRSIDVDIGKLSKADQAQIMQILLLKFLSQKNRESVISSTSQFHIAKFISEIDSSNGEDIGILSLDKMKDALLASWRTNIADRQNFAGHQTEYLTEEGNAKLMLTLFTSTSKLAVKIYPKLLLLIVRLMQSENSGALRKLAVKSLSHIVQVDPSLMMEKNNRDAVAMRFNDEAISVREAAVNLVGTFVLQAPESAKTFHQPLLVRLSDPGVSVRKRVIKIFRDLIFTNPAYPERAVVFIKFLERASDRKEDDGVRDLVLETFRNLWFEATSSSRKSKSAAFDTAAQMVEVVTSSAKQFGTPRSLVTLIQEMIIGQGSSEEEKKKVQRIKESDAALSYCRDIVASLIEMLVRCDEERGTLSQSEAGTKLVSIMSTLAVFAEASPSLLKTYRENLCPYLKADNGVSRKAEASVVFYTCKIISSICPSFSERDLQLIGKELPKDLKSIAYTFNDIPANAAIECFAKLATHEDGSESNGLLSALMKVARAFYKLLVEKEGSTTLSEVESSHVYRSLSTLGQICLFHKGDNNEEFEQVSPSNLTWDCLATSCFVLFEKYLAKPNIEIKCNALKAMSGVFTAHPRIFLTFHQEGTLSEILSDESDDLLKIAALKCLKEILEHEEIRVESGEAKRQMEANKVMTKSKKISGDQDGDASLLGMCVLEHIDRFYELTTSLNPKIRLGSVLLLETVRRQGLSNPMTLIPVIIALLGDSTAVGTRVAAKRILAEETEKNPKHVKQLFSEGISQCYDLQKKLFKDNTQHISALFRSIASNNTDQIECIVGQLFSDTIASGRAQVKKVVDSLITKIRRGRKMSNQDRILMSSFIAEIIAYLPYNHLQDVLHVVSTIHRHVGFDGNELGAKIHAFLQPYGVVNEDFDFGDIDALERAALQPNSPAAKAIKRIDKHKFAALCSEASSVVLLLRVSSFLRDSYASLTDKRLNDYFPGEKEKIADRGVTRVSRTTFNSSIPHSGSINDCIFQYAAFRAALRNFDG